MSKLKKALKIILGITFGIVVIFIAFTIFSHVYYHRSVMATIVEYYKSTSKVTSTESETRAELQQLKNEPEKEYSLPSNFRFTTEIKEQDESGMKAYDLNHQNKSNKIVIYIHGGAYIAQISTHHWSMLDNLAKATDCEIITPVYPLIPYHTWEDSYQKITNLYKRTLEANPNKKIILMGDSAGGGLSLGLAEYFAQEGIRQPDELVLLSPWVDVTMSNPDIAAYEKIDPMLASSWLKVYGKSWAGSLDTKDYRISPLYGNFSGLSNVTIFVGTRELLYPDEIVLYNKLRKNDISSRLIVGEGMNHVYPVYSIPEAKTARKQIADIITR